MSTQIQTDNLIVSSRSVNPRVSLSAGSGKTLIIDRYYGSTKFFNLGSPYVISVDNTYAYTQLTPSTTLVLSNGFMNGNGNLKYLGVATKVFKISYDISVVTTTSNYLIVGISINGEVPEDSTKSIFQITTGTTYKIISGSSLISLVPGDITSLSATLTSFAGSFLNVTIPSINLCITEV